MLDPARQRIWREMVAKSFHPRQWYVDDQRDDAVVQEETLMWVYRQTSGGYEVGYFDPNRNWHADSTVQSVDEARERVHWLNGGSA